MADLVTNIVMVGKDMGATKTIGDVTKGMAGLASAATSPIRALGSLAGSFGDVTKMALGFAGGAVLTQLPGALLDMAKGAAADEQATIRLGQSIRNLGGDYDSIMGKVNEAIEAGQRLAFTDDEVRDSFQFLAAATGDADEALRRQKAAMDLARGANIPLGQATKMLGRINEENVNVFRRMGIVLADNATEADALAAVQAKFGAQADAYAKSTAGQFAQAQIAMDEVRESIGSALLPVLTAVGKVLSDNLPAIQAFVGTLAGGIADHIIPAVTTAATFIGALADTFIRIATGAAGFGELRDVLSEFADNIPLIGAILPIIDAIGPAIAPVLDMLGQLTSTVMAVLPDLGTAISQAFAFFQTGGGDIEVFRGVLNRLMGEEGAQRVIVVFTNLVGFIRNDLIPIFQQVGQIVTSVLSGDLSGALSQVGTLVAAVAPQIGAALLDWGRQFIAWVQVAWPPLQAELVKIGQQVLAWIQQEGPEILAVLGEWARSFVAWVAPFIPPLLIELGKAAFALLGWLAEQQPVIIAQLQKWAQEFIVWVAPLIPPLLLELAKIGLAVGLWLGEQALVLAGKFLTEWVPAFLGWLVEIAPKALVELEKFKAALGTWIVNDAAPWLLQKAWEIGGAILRGIWEGQERLRDWLTGKIVGLLTSIVDSAKRALGISSPSEVWAEEIGVPLVQGIIVGVEQEWPHLDDRLADHLGDTTHRVADWTERYRDQVGKPIVKQIIIGIEEEWPHLDDRLADHMRDTGHRVADWTEKYREQVGKPIVENIIIGVEQEWPHLDDRLADHMGDTAHRVADWTERYREQVGKPIVENIVIGVEQEAETLDQTVRELLDFGPAFDDTEDAARQAGEALVQGLIDGVDSEWARLDDRLADHTGDTTHRLAEALRVGIEGQFVRIGPAIEAGIEELLEIPPTVIENWKDFVDLTGKDLSDAWDIVAQHATGFFNNLEHDLLGASDMAQQLINLLNKVNLPGGGGGGGGAPGDLFPGPRPGAPGPGGGLQPAALAVSVARTERVAASASGGIVWTGNLIVNGSVLTERDLIDAVHTGLLSKQRRNGSLGLAGT